MGNLRGLGLAPCPWHATPILTWPDPAGQLLSTPRPLRGLITSCMFKPWGHTSQVTLPRMTFVPQPPELPAGGGHLRNHLWIACPLPPSTSCLCYPSPTPQPVSAPSSLCSSTSSPGLHPHTLNLWGMLTSTMHYVHKDTAPALLRTETSNPVKGSPVVRTSYSKEGAFLHRVL